MKQNEFQETFSKQKKRKNYYNVKIVCNTNCKIVPMFVCEIERKINTTHEE